MTNYLIYSGKKTNGDLERLAIAVDDEENFLDGIHKQDVGDFFTPGTEEIECVGKITVCGDDHLLDDCFSVRF